MRIIAGKFRHREIIYPENIPSVRPTKDRVREAIFSALGNVTNNAVVLDLFAGSGAYGLEALSRDAAFVTFNDNFDPSYKAIKANLKSLNVTNAEVFFKDYKECLNRLENKYSLIFLDPPYKDEVYLEIIKLMVEKNLVKENATFVLESDHVLSLHELNLSFFKQYHYGKTYVAILRIS